MDFSHTKLSEHYWDKTTSYSFESLITVSLLLFLYCLCIHSNQLHNLTKCQKKKNSQGGKEKGSSILALPIMQ